MRIYFLKPVIFLLALLVLFVLAAIGIYAVLIHYDLVLISFYVSSISVSMHLVLLIYYLFITKGGSNE